jgi:hypothetical protein
VVHDSLTRWVGSRPAISAQSGPRDSLLKPESDTKTFVTETLAINYLSLHGRFILYGRNLRQLTKSPGIVGNYADAVDAEVIGVRHFFTSRQTPYPRQPYRDNDRKAPLHSAVEYLSDLHVTQAWLGESCGAALVG